MIQYGQRMVFPEIIFRVQSKSFHQRASHKPFQENTEVISVIQNRIVNIIIFIDDKPLERAGVLLNSLQENEELTDYARVEMAISIIRVSSENSKTFQRFHPAKLRFQLFKSHVDFLSIFKKKTIFLRGCHLDKQVDTIMTPSIIRNSF